MPSEFVHRRRVEFAETDMAGIMHFTNFFRFMESAEHAFFRSLGFSVARPDGDGRLGLPRVHAHCDYLAPLRFEDEVEIRLRVAKKSRRSLTYHFTLRRVHPAPEVEAARGVITVVCVEHRADGTLKAVPLPEALARALEAAPPEERRRAGGMPLKKRS
ncbi:thioesterase family protein [Fontisphaera persica]|uniref:acyl-CoA thioesterase n=1 Tax=Fontisphaera persica TaxID=2974023 RepID=UPI0024BFFFDB|nr:thioesterase family protein [Fontisphaera persica]WCJ58693.1 thioesterase family protein [Fontisphaera persica]